MTAHGPVSLQMLAGNSYLDQIIHAPDMELYHETAKFILKDDLERLSPTRQIQVEKLKKVTRMKLKKLTMEFHKPQVTAPGVRRVIRNCLMHRAALEEISTIELFAQIGFSSTVMLQETLMYSLMMLNLLGETFPNISYLKTAGSFILDPRYVKICLEVFPNLKKIKLQTNLHQKSVEMLGCKLENLEKCIIMTDAECSRCDSNLLASSIFFSKLTPKEVTQKRLKNLPVNLSCKKLKIMAWPFKWPQDLDFMTNFVHFYPKVQLYWIPQISFTSGISVFERALHPALSANPNHALRHCELRFDDLRFPFVHDTLKNWTRLQSLSVLISDTSNHVDLGLAGKRLKNIFDDCAKLNNLQIIVNTQNLAPFQITLKALEGCGKRLVSLSVLDHLEVISHKSLVKLINTCPNIKSLQLEKTPSLDYCKTSQLVPLNNLLDFKVLFYEVPHSQDVQVTANFAYDIMNCAPNIVQLTTPFDDALYGLIMGTTLSCNIRKWSVHILIENRLESMTYKLGLLIQKMYLDEVTITAGTKTPILRAVILNQIRSGQINSVAQQMRDLDPNCRVQYTSPTPVFDYRSLKGMDKDLI